MVLELDGLIQRFGRLVPDAVALLHQVRAIRGQLGPGAAALEVVIARFGPGDEATVAADLEALGLTGLAAALDARATILRDPAALTAGKESIDTMLLAGRSASAREALAAGLPAYVVEDRQARDHRRLAIAEAPRVIAESLRLATPRPMSDDSRAGSLIAVPADGSFEARARAIAVAAADPWADWLALGGWQIFHAGGESAVDRLMDTPRARRLAGEVHRSELALAGPGMAAGPGGALFEAAGFRLGLVPDVGGLEWRRVRRGWFAAPSYPRRPSPPALASVRDAAASGGAEASGWSVADPFADDNEDALLAIVEQGDGPLAMRIGEELRAAGCGAGLLYGFGFSSPAEALERLLWEGEINRLRAIVRIRPGRRPALDVAPGDPFHPADILVTVPDRPGAGVEPDAVARRAAAAIMKAANPR